MNAENSPKRRKSIRYTRWGYVFIAPFFIIFIIFSLFPMLSTVYYSFFKYYRQGLKIIGPTFIGLENFSSLFKADLPNYLGNTLILWIIGFIPQIVISLLLAAWFTNQRLHLRGQGFFKTVIYMILQKKNGKGAYINEELIKSEQKQACRRTNRQLHCFSHPLFFVPVFLLYAPDQLYPKQFSDSAGLFVPPRKILCHQPE